MGGGFALQNLSNCVNCGVCYASTRAIPRLPAASSSLSASRSPCSPFLSRIKGCTLGAPPLFTRSVTHPGHCTAAGMTVTSLVAKLSLTRSWGGVVAPPSSAITCTPNRVTATHTLALLPPPRVTAWQGKAATTWRHLASVVSSIMLFCCGEGGVEAAAAEAAVSCGDLLGDTAAADRPSARSPLQAAAHTQARRSQGVRSAEQKTAAA